MRGGPGVSAVVRYEVRLSPTRAQWLWAAAGAAAAWFCLYRMTTSTFRQPGVLPGAVGIGLYLVEIGYLIFLRSQYSSLEVSGTELRFLKEHLPLSELRIAVSDWYRCGARGALIGLHSRTRRVRLGVKSRPRLTTGAAWSCDAEISRSDAEDLLRRLHPDGSPHFPQVVSAHSPRRAPALAGMAPWLLTIALLGGFGVTVGVYFPELTASVEGRLLSHTIVLGAITVGIVTTFTGWHERTGTLRPTEEDMRAASLIPRAPPEGATGRPTFARSSYNMATWMATSMLGAALLFAPVFGVHEFFRHYVDIPACTADCEAGGTTFADYRSSKQGSFCTCRGQEGGTSTNRVSYNLTGGRGFVHGLVDVLVRSIAYLGIPLLWAAALLALAVTVSSKVRRKLGR